MRSRQVILNGPCPGCMVPSCLDVRSWMGPIRGGAEQAQQSGGCQCHGLYGQPHLHGHGRLVSGTQETHRGHFSEMFMGQRRGLCRGRAGGNTLVGLHYETCSNRKIMFRNNIVGVAALRLHQATKVWNILAIVVGFSTYIFPYFASTSPQGTTRDSSKFR